MIETKRNYGGQSYAGIIQNHVINVTDSMCKYVFMPKKIVLRANILYVRRYERYDIFDYKEIKARQFVSNRDDISTYEWIKRHVHVYAELSTNTLGGMKYSDDDVFYEHIRRMGSGN